MAKNKGEKNSPNIQHGMNSASNVKGSTDMNATNANDKMNNQKGSTSNKNTSGGQNCK